MGVLFYYEQQIKGELKRKIHIRGCRCNERLKTKTDGSTHLAYTGLCKETERLFVVYYNGEIES